LQALISLKGNYGIPSCHIEGAIDSSRIEAPSLQALLQLPNSVTTISLLQGW
jgi:hypothetical protein